MTPGVGLVSRALAGWLLSSHMAHLTESRGDFLHCPTQLCSCVLLPSRHQNPHFPLDSAMGGSGARGAGLGGHHRQEVCGSGPFFPRLNPWVCEWHPLPRSCPSHPPENSVPMKPPVYLLSPLWQQRTPCDAGFTQCACTINIQ